MRGVPTTMVLVRPTKLGALQVKSPLVEMRSVFAEIWISTVIVAVNAIFGARLVVEDLPMRVISEPHVFLVSVLMRRIFQDVGLPVLQDIPVK